MVANPYIAAHVRQARHRLRTGGIAAPVARVVLGLAAVALGAVLLRTSFFAFLEAPSQGVAAGASGLVLRLGLILVGLAAIDAYEAVLRGEDRAVLGLLPVSPGPVVVAALVQLVARRWWTVPAAAGLLLPLALEAGVGPWAAAVAALAGIQVLAWPLAAVVYLLAVDAADSPAWAPLLDLVRGANPRPQAAFLYAPGVVLLVAAAGLWAATEGTAAAVDGSVPGAALLLISPVGGLLCAAAVPVLGRRAWVRAGAVLAEIDARWASLVEHDGDRRSEVYLEWTVRFFPTSWRRALLHDLRHGWRGRRIFVAGAWVLGLAAAAAGWTEDPAGPARALVVGGLGVAVVGAVAFALVADEPPFLRWWLPDGPGWRAGARVVAIALWSAPVPALAALAAAFFAGFPAGAAVLGAALLAALTTAGLAVALSRIGRAGPWLYAPLAAIVVLGVAVGVGGWP